MIQPELYLSRLLLPRQYYSWRRCNDSPTSLLAPVGSDRSFNWEERRVHSDAWPGTSAALCAATAVRNSRPTGGHALDAVAAMELPSFAGSDSVEIHAQQISKYWPGKRGWGTKLVRWFSRPRKIEPSNLRSQSRIPNPHSMCSLMNSSTATYQATMLRGFRIQWFSSGNRSSSLGTPWYCSASKRVKPSLMGQR
jgi:hypothetical protein